MMNIICYKDHILNTEFHIRFAKSFVGFVVYDSNLEETDIQFSFNGFMNKKTVFFRLVSAINNNPI